MKLRTLEGTNEFHFDTDHRPDDLILNIFAAEAAEHQEKGVRLAFNLRAELLNYPIVPYKDAWPMLLS